MLSTQRNESMNHAIKKRIRHYKRSNIIRIISIVSDMMDEKYFEVNLFKLYFKLLRKSKPKIK